jgi:hypothetical protein
MDGYGEERFNVDVVFVHTNKALVSEDKTLINGRSQVLNDKLRGFGFGDWKNGDNLWLL